MREKVTFPTTQLIPGGSGTHGSTARAVSDDGAVVAGESEGTFQWREAFRWTQETGMVVWDIWDCHRKDRALL